MSKKNPSQDLLSSLNAVISTNESTRFIIGHVIYNPAYTYKFQLKTTQVVNYGAGGHYEPHVDYFGPAMEDTNQGDRVATMLYYLSDDIVGGKNFCLLKFIYFEKAARM